MIIGDEGHLHSVNAGYVMMMMLATVRRAIILIRCIILIRAVSVGVSGWVVWTMRIHVGVFQSCFRTAFTRRSQTTEETQLDQQA